ncbi:MAG: transglutaminase family protein [Gemmatimonadota bacterium]
MQIHVGFEFLLESGTPTPVVSVVRPREDLSRIGEERYAVTPDVPIHRYCDIFGNQVWRWTAPAGSMRIAYHALAEVSGVPDPRLVELPGTPVEQLPDELLQYTLPSRYCPSDRVLDDAWGLFGAAPEGWARVQAVCDWVHANVAYGGQSGSSTTGYDTYAERAGVCRDFAHVAVMFCRALNIPARYICGYLPDIGVPPDGKPMDFHAWFEAYVGGGWRTFDARHNVPRIGRVVIARGRDAVDTAFLTTYGDSRLVELRVWADEAEGNTTLEGMVDI